MSKESGNKIIGGVILLGVLFVLICIIESFIALENNNFIGVGILMLAASLPISVAIYSVLQKK